MQIRRDLANVFYAETGSNRPGYTEYFIGMDREKLRRYHLQHSGAVPPISMESYLKHADNYFKYSRIPEVLRLMRAYDGLPTAPAASVANTELPAFHIHKKPVQPVLPFGPQRMDLIQPQVSMPLPARAPVSVPAPLATVPLYRFRGGFVDPRVAAASRQSSADDELLTRKQLEYRSNLQQQR